MGVFFSSLAYCASQAKEQGKAEVQELLSKLEKVRPYDALLGAS